MMKQLKPLRGFPGVRCDEGDCCSSFGEKLLLAFVAGAAPIAAQAIFLKLFPELSSGDEPETDDA